ncbi:hypothetical protein BR93DRAFT_162054 [Coniochaeta sp. PMI_546]|nr:hypothetical protein BR93DRAFT_162054 [Coniochaeta sp. PMI_546]
MPSKETESTTLPPAHSSRALADRGKQLKAPDTEDRLRHNQRARDNQRSSRARRKELLNDLQRRVDAYERSGVQATLEMQQAARRVAWENVKLRALLMKKGVAEAEVEDWLHGNHEAVGDRMAGEARMDSAPCTARVSVTALLNEEPLTPAASSYHPGPLSVSSSTSRASTLRSGQSSAPPDEDHTSTSSASLQGDGENFPSLAERVAACCTSGTETSCEVAAAILASMQGHGDTSRARAALGCNGPSECTVKNTRVLELLDETG